MLTTPTKLDTFNRKEISEIINVYSDGSIDVLIGIRNGEMYIIHFRQLTQHEIDYWNAPEQVQEHYRDMWENQISDGRTTDSLEDFAQDCWDNDVGRTGYYYPGCELSYCEYANAAYNKLTDDEKAQIHLKSDFVDWTITPDFD